MIGIGVTSHNRHALTQKTLNHISALAPKGSRIVVVDDASIEPPPFQVNYRFERNVGIARAKNKCLELLDDCEHVFLFDDDTYPTMPGWCEHYTSSPEAHLMYIFTDFADGTKLNDTVTVYNAGGDVAYSHPRGCMLYFKRAALDAVGGFDPAFGKWGHEHIDLSDRIHAAGLTTFPYMDVAGSSALFYSGDEHRKVPTTMPNSKRPKQLARNVELYKQRGYSARYIDYHDQGVADVVLTCYLTGMNDPQRHAAWTPNDDELKPLAASVGMIAPDAELVILNNELNDRHTVSIDRKQSPYWQRWILMYQWLMKRPHVRNVWLVDATDVEMLRDPFPHMETGALYVGDEPATTAIPWMYNNHHAGYLHKFFNEHRRSVLLNCGLIGGSRYDVMELLRRMLRELSVNRDDVAFKRERSVGETDMGLFNYVCRTQMGSRIEHGPHVNTQFKAYKDNGKAWWMHK